MPLRKGAAGIPGGAPVDGGVADFLRDMRCNTHPPERGHKVGTVLSLVRPERQAPGRTLRVPIDHLERRLALAVTIGVG